MRKVFFFSIRFKVIRLLYVAFITISTSFCAFSQQESLMGRVNIASPNATSIGKYGDVPVSYHTGVPNISIPLHTLTSGSIQLPISLSYHAGGLRVEENDSWVGAGWTLNAGGVITRTVKDKPDEKQTGSLTQTHGYFSDYGFTGAPKNQSTGSIANPEYVDKEPDLFSFNFNGYSGKFYFNDDRTPLIVPEQDIKIEYNYKSGIWNGSPGLWSGLGRCIEGFKLTTPDGTKYYFGINPLFTITSPYCDPIEVTSTYASTTGSNYSQVITSWFLYKIESVDGSQTITLEYERDKFAYYTYINNLNYKNTNNNNRYTLVKNYVAGIRVSKITAANGSVNFIQGSVRQDLSGWNASDLTQLNEYANTTSKSLGSININNTKGELTKKILFNHNYFTDNTTSLSSYFQGWGIQYDTKRLKLVSVQEQSSDGSITKPPYSFEYFTEPIVRKLSFAKDHWGYNNGAINNSELYPELFDNNYSLNVGIGLSISNREAAWPAMRGGALSKITYPTGGYTNFDFEQHKYYILENGVNVDKTIGGLRIKSITNYDPVANKSIVTNYSYVEGASTLSSGILFSKPTYIQIYRNDWSRRVRYWGISNDNGCFYPADASTIRSWPFLFSDNPLRPMETTQGYHIGYKEVKVSQVGNGYSIFRFHTGPTWPLPDRTGVAFTKMNNPGPCDISIPNLPAAPPEHDFKRGELVYEGQFNNDGQVLIERNFLSTYISNPITAPGLIVDKQFDVAYVQQTLYEIKTARKTETSVQEIIYQRPSGTSLTSQTQTFYESNYHHQPTKIISTDSRGIVSEKRIKYSFDYRVPLFENTVTCNDPSASFLTYTNNLFNSSYQADFITCNGFNNGCYNTHWSSFNSALFNARQSFINCRRINYTNQYTPTTALNTYQTNHNLAKSNADVELKPVLWMQDIYMNMPIEISEWKGGQLLAATYTKYNNLRDDEYGVYPEKLYKIDLKTPSAIFQPSAVSGNGNSLTKDSRYNEVSTFDFNEGNVIGVVGRDGVATSYEWGYANSLPIAKIINAANKEKENSQPGQRTTSYSAVIGPSNNTCFDRQETFYHTAQGTIMLNISSVVPPSATVTASYTLTGPNNYMQTGSLCKQSSGAGCSGSPASISFTNVPPGNYTISYTVCTPFQSYSFNSTFSYTYNGLVIAKSGLKEFFVANFEEGTNGTEGNAHTGFKYFNGNYTTSFSPSNYSSKGYRIQWWNLTNGQWIFNSQPYFIGMLLTGPVDNIRIFPNDAQIITYTYNSSRNISSEINTNGYVQYYDYDAFGRLIVVRDSDKKILKRLCYNYAGQIENCSVNTTASWVPTGMTRCKPCPSNPIYTTNILQEQKFDSNPNSTTYNQYNWFDVGVNSSCGQAAWQNEGSPFCELNGSGQNTGNQLQLQRDMNPCSPTYNTTQTVLIGYNINACPLPASCNTSNCTGEGYKCVYGSCEYGYRVYTDSYYDYGSGMTVCVYHYEWSDGTWSDNYYEYNYGHVFCPIMTID